MKKLATFFVLFLISTNLFSQSKSFWFEYQGTAVNNSYSQLIASSFTFQKENGVGFASFALLASEWGELYAGPIYGHEFKNNFYIEANVSIGIETNSFPLRTATYLYGKKDNFWFLVNYEYGGSGDWYLGIIEYKFKNFGIGVHAQKFATHGVRLSYSTKDLSFWSVVGVGMQAKPSFTFGLRYNL